jgi:DNA-directed RNA polymerase II subunit RPB1
MTLNTFHLAGVSAKNVTLGVPRLKEIINVAKTIKTPSLAVYLKKDVRQDTDKLNYVHGLMEYTTINDVLFLSGIYFDPENTMIKADERLIKNYVDNSMEFGTDGSPVAPSKWQDYGPWVLRLELDSTKLAQKTINIEQIKEKIEEHFGDKLLVLHSDQNDDKQIMRIRLKAMGDADTMTSVELKEILERLLNEFPLKGFKEISKVYRTKYIEQEYNPDTGEYIKPPTIVTDSKNQMLETDGVALSKVFAIPEVDHTRTISNDIIEIMEVLGIEAVRKALIKELRVVLDVYGIYVNYRHLATLCDVMTQRGILTSITRHGINRVDTGPLRKASFEETVEILYEASVFHEIDSLKGITENIIMGQLAPFGTGCFDLVADMKMLENAIENEDDQGLPDSRMSGGMMVDDYAGGPGDDTQFTPVAHGTPNPGSVYDGGITPSVYGGYGQFSEYQGGMASAYSQNMQSPSYQTGQSPKYNAGQPGGSQLSTPIYRPGASPAPGQSPAYSPTQSFHHAPGQSPAYSPAPGASPAYSPTGAGGPGMSPAYSPTSAQGYNPVYSGSSPSYAAGINARQSPSYSPGGGAASIHSGGSGYSPQQPMYNPSAPFAPSSPAYNPNIGGAAEPAYKGGAESDKDSEENSKDSKE